MPIPRKIIIEGNDRVGYVARMPDLGLQAHGSTVDEAEDSARALLIAYREKPGIVQVEASS